MRRLCKVLLAMGLAAMFSTSGSAQDYPTHTIRVVLGFGAGGTTDAIARYYAQRLSKVLKAPVIVDNKPGAGQIVAIRSDPRVRLVSAQPSSWFVLRPMDTRCTSEQPVHFPKARGSATTFHMNL